MQHVQDDYYVHWNNQNIHLKCNGLDIRQIFNPDFKTYSIHLIIEHVFNSFSPWAYSVVTELVNTIMYVGGVLYNFVFIEFSFKTVSGDVTAFHRIAKMSSTGTIWAGKL